MEVMLHNQEKFPLATLVLEADKRGTPQKQKLLALARRVAEERGIVL